MSSGLTPEERTLLDLTADLYNAYCELPVYHPQDGAEFVQKIHAVQDSILKRPAMRELQWERIAADSDGVSRE